MRSFAVGLGCALAAVGFALPVQPASAAATPCWKGVIADWSRDRTIDGRYPTTCVQQAMLNAPTDLKIYSTLEDDLQAALRARSVRRLAGVHASAASLAAPGGSSPLSPLVIVFGGLGVLAAACTCGALLRRRRSAR